MRFRFVYLGFVIACGIFLLPLLSDEPPKWGGFRGGGDGRLMTISERIAFHTFALFLALFAGWLSVTTLMKDYWSSRGSISQKSYSFSFSPVGHYKVNGICGTGPAFFEVGLRLLDSDGDELDFGTPVIFRCAGTRLQYHQLFLQNGVHEQKCEFSRLRKGSWEAEIQVDWPDDCKDERVCELKIKTYSSANKPVVLPDVEVAT